MCARYKAPDDDAPQRRSAAGAYRRGQAPPQPRTRVVRPTRREMAEEEVAGDELDGDGLSPVGMAGVEYSGGRGEDFPQPDAVGGAEWSRRRLRRPVGGDGAWFGSDDAAPDAAQERDAGYGERGATGESGPTVPPAGTVDGRVDSAFGTPGPERQYRRHAPGEPVAPWEEFRMPPRKGMTFWRAVWKLVTLPFRVIAFCTRTLPRMVLLPIRLLLSFCFVGCVAGAVVAVLYGIKAERYDITQVLRMPERSIVLDRKGNEIGTLHGENRRSISDLHGEVPQYFIDALVMQEDRSFWTHGGVDPRGVLRALAQVAKHHRTTQGASTLTMQLAKNTYNHRVRNMDAKLLEVALARRIEATYDKETILTCYINRVFWGHTFLGLKQAAYGYFNKLPRDLTIGEAALLAGIICSPNEFSPYRNPSAARTQRDKVLKLMHDNGYITRNEYQAALAEPIVTHMPERRGNDNYALDLIRREVDHILTMLDSEQQRIKEESIYAGGLTIRTTLDVDLQDDAMHEMDDRLTEMFEQRRGYRHQTRAGFVAEKQALLQTDPEAAARMQPKYLQAACVLIDNATGALLAVVGGRDSTESALNRAVQSRRQVGSLFKPIVYTTFFERGGSPNTIISDDRLQPGEIPNARRWNPGNSDGRFTGPHPAGWGLLKSRNTMTVRVGTVAGLKNVVSSALMAGFPPMAAKPGPTIFLGTWEASPLEVASAFTVFANGGVRPTPYIIESITDADGHVLWQNQPSVRRVFSQRSTAATTAILQQITKPGGTAGRTQQLGFTAPCGGKTGTTNAYKNAWFCGFTSNITAAVWVGFDRPATIADRAYGGTVALPLWVGIMKRAQERGYAMGEIRQVPAAPRSLGLKLCRVSGNLAHEGCDYAGTSYIDTMVDLTKPRPLCTVHEVKPADPYEEEVAVDPDAEDVAVDPDALPDVDAEDVAVEAEE